MNVPIAKREVQMEAPGVASPRIAPITEKAFGGDVSAAKTQFAGAVMGAAAKLGAAIAERQNFDREQAVHDALQPVQQEMYERTHGKDGFATLQGIQARGATEKFISEYQPAKEKFIQQFKDPRQAALAKNQYDAIYNNHLSSVISNEGRQVSIAEQQGLASAAQTAAQAAAANPKLLPSEDPVWLAATSRAREYYEKTLGPDAAKLEVQKLNDLAAQERVKLHPEDAEKLMGMDLSPSGKALVRGVQLDQMVKRDFENLDAKFKMPDGSFNLAKVQDKYKADKSLNASEAEKAFENFSSMDTRAQRVLDDGNKADSMKFFDIASNPATDLDSAKRAAAQFASKLRNGQVDHNDLRLKLRFIDEVNRGANGSTDPEIYNRLYQGIDKDGDVTAKMIVDEREKGNISKTAMQSLTQFLYGQRSEIMQNRMKLIENSKLVPQDDSKKAVFMAMLRQEALFKRVTNPDDLQKLAQTLSAESKTGNVSFWGKLTNASQSSYKSAGVMSQHPDIVRAAGGPLAAAAFAQRVGGVEKFEGDTGYPEAVAYLLSKEWSLDNMTGETLETVAARLAEKKNGKP